MRRSRRFKCLQMLVYFSVYVFFAVYSNRIVDADAFGEDDDNGVGEVDILLPEPSQSSSSSATESMTSPEEEEATITAIESGTEETLEHNGTTTPAYPHPTWRPKRQNCTPPAIEQFPRPLMGPWGRQHGGIVIHVLVAVYTFLGLAIVCDEYFVASLDRICEELKLSPDVAGATFMAAGSSAPELATVIIGVFFAKDDIGVSGVIGSAVFNIMFVISVCALCTSTVCYLNWWPLCRDCIFYALSILIMLFTIFDDTITWGEALFMLIMYAVYCVTLHFNPRLEKWAQTLQIPIVQKMQQQRLANQQLVQPVVAQPAEESGLVTYKTLEDDSARKQNYGSGPDQNGYTDPSGGWGDSYTTETSLNMWDEDPYKASAAPQPPPQEQPQPQPAQPVDDEPTAVPVQQQQNPSYYRPKENTEERVNPLIKPESGIYAQASWAVVFPIHFMCRKTIPDCKSERYRNWYAFTFFVSIVWISFYSYFMVWMITIIGTTFGIPDTVMGLTFVAAGVSVPDALSSIAVIKEGYGDMAVSNAVGSNVFDILVCLGLPWFIQTAIIKPGSHVNVISKGLTYSTLSLLSTVVFLVVATHMNGWKLDRKYGIILMVWYLIFITFASLYELNFFGQLNPPECLSLY